jgi:hypothetical protein
MGGEKLGNVLERRYDLLRLFLMVRCHPGGFVGMVVSKGGTNRSVVQVPESIGSGNGGGNIPSSGDVCPRGGSM